ncbi:MAG: calcium-binding protein, partial [Pseudomonadota bacterium]
MTQINGTRYHDRIVLGSGVQSADGGAGNDRIVAYSDGGEPVPAQTGDPNDRAHPPVPAGGANDVLTGGAGRDIFEFRLLIDAKEDVIAAHTGTSGNVNWGGVAGENDNVHDHWVEGIGDDVITDFSKAEGDKIAILGHTTQIKNITSGADEGGSYTLITLHSVQHGGAAGANTVSGAHDKDELGTIKVYGDAVTAADITVEDTTEGIDRLERADATVANTATQVAYLNTNGDSYQGALHRMTDKVFLGFGAQTVDTGGGNDAIYSYSDAGEPDPAQTDGAAGRVNAAIDPAASVDILKGGQGRDTFNFRILLNAKQEILDKHTRDDGSINWRKVAGENDNVHDHWVEGIGDDVILDFSKQDGDEIDIRGHTVELASITQGADAGGQFSLIKLRSQQGDKGGAHDEDPVGSIKVYGDVVEKSDVFIKKSVFYGIDELDKIAAEETGGVARPAVEQIQYDAVDPNTIDIEFEGTRHRDVLKLGSGVQSASGGGGRDRLISFADAGEPDPAQTGGTGRINPAIAESATMDILEGGEGADRFEFHALLNARREVIEQHTGSDGDVNWRKVAGENDNVHDHWVQGFGYDTILDYSKTEGDKIIIRGHTVEIASVTYGSDAGGKYSLIAVRSQQGDGGAGGANTATGAHDEDSLGKIKVYGETVAEADITVQAAGVFDGADRLIEVDKLAGFNGGVQEIYGTTDGVTVSSGPATLDTVDRIIIGAGSQTVNAGVGRDAITSYSDAGEPDPAQTPEGVGLQTTPPDPNTTNDIISGGQDRDVFTFNFLLNATEEIRAEHTRADGSINWRGVAGENDAVHLHWVEGIGHDVVLDYSNQDGDKIVLRGHTVEIASVEHVENSGPEDDYTLITVRSQQGDNGGAHDEDPLGSVKVFGDAVEIDDIIVQKKVFDGVDRYEEGTSAVTNSLIYGDKTSEVLNGTAIADVIHAEGGADLVRAGGGEDFVFGGGGRDTLFGGSEADFLSGEGGNDQVHGEAGNDILFAASGTDTLFGGTGADTFRLGNGLREAEIMDWSDGEDLI